ncbi:aldo/keto reductase [Paenibacillus sp. GCM10027626]|uniref:aldo/keto reductase n=1 Tax=Paenibacillus sp. GCM10027626 TaxID=3273411 RepID=UPI0036264EB6
MKYRTLGSTGMNVSVIGVGTWQFGGEWGKSYSQAEVNSILDTAKSAGINLIDTAECYGDHLSESLIGGYLKTANRQDWIVATKFGHKFHSHLNRTQHWSAQEVLKQLESSLQALQTDYIDLYQFHSGTDEVFNNDELWTMLDKQVQAGKIRHLGLSVGIKNNQHQTDTASQVGAETIQVVYNRLDRQPEEGVFPSCLRQNLGVLARVPLASGYLSGKYKPGAVFGENDVRKSHDQEAAAARLRQVEEIQRQEVPAGVDMAQWALAWCLRHEAVTCVIPGCKDEAQVLANAAASELVSAEHRQAAE